MADKIATEWNGTNVRKWLESRVAASRLDQVAAERAGWGQHDDCDKATAEEIICTTLLSKRSTDDREAFAQDLRALLDQDEHLWRGVYDDTKFDRHVRPHVRKLVRMTKTNEGFEKTGRHQ